ncbi:MAG: hypothetical protein ACLQMF_20635 [Rectinemataceae bacterium]
MLKETRTTRDESGKPYAHGLGLPTEWIEAHRDLCEEADRLQAR